MRFILTHSPSRLLRLVAYYQVLQQPAHAALVLAEGGSSVGAVCTRASRITGCGRQKQMGVGVRVVIKRQRLGLHSPEHCAVKCTCVMVDAARTAASYHLYCWSMDAAY